MAESMKVNGKMIEKKEKATNSSIIRMSIKETTISEDHMEKAGMSGKMERPIKESG